MIKKISFKKNTGRPVTVRKLMGITLAVFLAFSVLCTAVYLISGTIKSPAAAFFESVSAFTTTGTTVFEDVSTFPVWLKIFRAFCQWLGGVSAILFFACLSGNAETWNESDSPVLQIGPRFTKAAKKLICSYCILTVIQIILLFLCRCTPLDAVCLSLSGISTGGFSTGMQIGGMAEVIIFLFMILTMINYTIFYHAAAGHKDKFEKNTELSALLWIIVGGCLIVSADLLISGTYGLRESLEHGFFQTVSSMSTTGYMAADVSKWPSLAKTILTALSFIGGSSLSAASGIRVIRLVVILKILSRSFTVRIHPKAVVSPNVNGKQLNRESASAISSFFLTYIAIYLLGVFVISFESGNFISCFELSAALINNSGFCASGAVSISAFGPVLQILMSFLMIAGRLELYTVLIPFSRDN